MYTLKLNKRKRFDLFVLFVLIALAAMISLAVHATLLTSFFLYLAIPAFYLCWRQKKNYLKIFLASSVVTTLGISLDVIAEYNRAWSIPTTHPLLPYHLWGIMPIELVLWGFCVALFTFVFYEHFLDDERHPALSKHFLFLLISAIFMLCLVGSVAAFIPHALSVRYAYVILFVVAELPLVWVLFWRPRLLRKFIWLSLFFFILNSIFEVTALMLNQWTFPGQYIGWVNVFGLALPWEELILWMLLSSPLAVLYYEEFFDDGR